MNLEQISKTAGIVTEIALMVSMVVLSFAAIILLIASIL